MKLLLNGFNLLLVSSLCVGVQSFQVTNDPNSIFKEAIEKSINTKIDNVPLTIVDDATYCPKYPKDFSNSNADKGPNRLPSLNHTLNLKAHLLTPSRKGKARRTFGVDNDDVAEYWCVEIYFLADTLILVICVPNICIQYLFIL